MPRNRQNLPTKFNKKASENGGENASRKARSLTKGGGKKLGTRSGAQFHSKKVAIGEDGVENMETFFKAQDEQMIQTENSSVSRPAAGEGGRAALKSGINMQNRHKPKTPKKVRMSVGGDDDGDETSVDSEEKKMPARKQPVEKDTNLDKDVATKLTEVYVAKLQTTVTSPSELSKVSTAPPTPFEEQETARFAKDDQEGDDDEQVDTDAPRADDELLTQPGTHEDDDDDEDVVLAQASDDVGDEKQPALMERAESPEPTFPPMGLDDLGPPEHSDNDENSFGLEPPDHSDDEADAQDGGKEQQQHDDGDKDQQSEDSSDNESSEKPESKQPEPAPAAAATSDSSNADSDDSDKEGTGFNMVHDPETPSSVRKQRAKEDKAALKRKKKKKRRGSDTSDSDDGDDTNDESTLQTPAKKQTKKKKKKRHVAFSPKGMPVGNRTYKRKPLDDFAVDLSDDEYDGVRRSRRARCKPLDFWRNERLEYGANNATGIMGEIMGDMPVVVNVIKAEDTPYKKRKPAKQQKKSNAKKKKTKGSGGDDEEEVKPFNLNKLKKKYKVIEGDVANLWDEMIDDPSDMKVIAYADNLEPSDLPLSKQRDEKDGFEVGQAAQAFNIPNDDNDAYVGYIMGNLKLPPKAIKDAESVGPCSQTFTVCGCQPKALEIAYGDPDLPEGILDPDSAQRFYLSPGDMFRVPPGNCYRLQNRSKTTDAFLTWTIIRPRNIANDEDSE